MSNPLSNPLLDHRLRTTVKRRLLEELRKHGVEEPRFFEYFVELVVEDLKKEIEEHGYSDKFIERMIERRIRNVLDVYGFIYGW